MRINLSMFACMFIILTYCFKLTDILCQSSKSIQEEVTIRNDSILLSGTFTKPSGEDKFTTLIFIWGNGPHTRDQEISGTPVFRIISDSLVNNGFATLRIDKRGFGKSTGYRSGSETVTTTLDLASDIEACREYLLTRNDVDTSKIGLIGHSEGAMIAPYVAVISGGIAFEILIAPPAVNGQEIFLSQRIKNMNSLGMEKDVIPKVYEQFEILTDFIKTDYSDDSVYYSIGKDFLMAHGLSENDVNNDFIDQVIDGFRNPWHQVFFNFDPEIYLSKLRIPVLAVFGREDNQVTVEQNAEPLKTDLEKAGNKNYKIEVLEDNDHYFLLYNGVRLEKHKPGEMEVSGELISTVLNWLDNLSLK